MGESVSLRHVRRNSLACSGGSAKAVLWCTCDGHNSTRCEFWLFRFGVGPKAFRRRFGPRLLDPRQMPPASVNLDDLPGSTEAAATAEINVEGYCAPAVEVRQRPKTKTLSPEHLAKLRAGRDRTRKTAASGKINTATQ